MIKGKELERLITFSDAIVAVAITLLVVPVTNQFQTLNKNNFLYLIKSSSFISTLVGFFISFFVIYNLWDGHRKIFSQVNSINSSVAALNRLWLLTIVLLPAVISLDLNAAGNISELLFAIILTLCSFLLQLIKIDLHSYKIYNSPILMLLILIIILLIIFPKLGGMAFLVLLLSVPLKKLFPEVFKE